MPVVTLHLHGKRGEFWSKSAIDNQQTACASELPDADGLIDTFGSATTILTGHSTMLTSRIAGREAWSSSRHSVPTLRVTSLVNLATQNTGTCYVSSGISTNTGLI